MFVLPIVCANLPRFSGCAGLRALLLWCLTHVGVHRCAAYARGAYRGWRAAKMRAGFMAQHRHDLLLWGEHEDLLLPGDNADLSDVAVTDGNDTYTNGAVKGAQGEDGAQQVAQQAHTEPAASTARL